MDQTTDNPTLQSEKLEPCRWCEKGNRPNFLDEDGTLVSITGNDGILSHAYDDMWWPCLKFGVELHCSRAPVVAPLPFALPVRIEGWHKSLTAGGWYIRDASNRIILEVAFDENEETTGRPINGGNPTARAVVGLINAAASSPASSPVVQEVYVSRHTVRLVCNQCGTEQIRSYKCPVNGCEGQLVAPSSPVPPEQCLNSLLQPQLRITAEGEEPEFVKCEVFDCNEYQHCIHYCAEHHKVICTPFTVSETDLIVGAIPLQAFPAATPTPVEQDCSRLDNWPIPDVLAHLASATEHLLQHHDCDEHGHETWKYAAEAARKHISLCTAGWQYVHERDAELIRKDGVMCEAHPGLEFGHDPQCSGPGMAWTIEGRSAIASTISSRDTEVREVLESLARWVNDEWCWCPQVARDGNGALIHFDACVRTSSLFGSSM